MRMIWRGLAAGVVLAAGIAGAQQSSAWTVKPEWVRAHEEFLSSDVMAGRGSATRDEEIAATYVASEFMAYGLKPAPGMTTYLQSAELSAPELDGKATITVGGVVLHEGADFIILRSNARDASGVVVRTSVAKAGETKGAALVVDSGKGTTSMQRIQSQGALSQLGAAMLLVPEDDSTKMLYSRYGMKTRTPMVLKDDADAPGTSIVAVKPEALEKLASGSTALLTLHVVPEAAPRKTFNAIGYLAGSDSASGTILLTAHLDHLGVGRAVNGDAIYNGANDDAAGTTAVLELAHALASGPKLKRNVLFVCYGSEEAGELGSTYFGAHSPVPLKDLVTNLEFEMIGNQDPKMPKGVLLLTGWERSNLGPTLKEHGALLGPDPYPEQHFFERSDNYALALKGVVAHTAAGWGTPPTYHQPNDDMEHLDIGFMTAAIQSLVEPVRWLASSDFVPKWNDGGQPKGR